MSYLKKPSNQEKMDYLLMVLNENKKHDKKSHLLFYSIYLVRFGTKVPVLYREPTSTDIKEQINKYSSAQVFNPDYLVVDLFTGKSRNVKKPIATFKFDYKTKQ